jgi:hypothetical protein
MGFLSPVSRVLSAVCSISCPAVELRGRWHGISAITHAWTAVNEHGEVARLETNAFSHHKSLYILDMLQVHELCHLLQRKLWLKKLATFK